MISIARSLVASQKTGSSLVKFSSRALQRWAGTRFVAGLALALSAFAASQAQATTTTITSTQTWTCPTGVTSVQVEAWGGGGGGGGVGSNYSGGGGGASGSYVEYTVSVTPGTGYPVTVGAGGAAGTGGASGSGGNGGTGGTTSFSTLVQAVGGPGGALDNTAGTSSQYTGSAGGTGTTSGNSPISGTAGNNGANGATGSAPSKTSGAGGTAPTGSIAGGAGGAAVTSAGNGKAGTQPGGGGSGGLQVTSASNGTGGVGGAGEVVLTYTAVAPTITATGTLSTLLGYHGTASGPTTFSASGTNLTANITVTAPSGFEISTSAGSGYASSLTLTQSGGSVAATTIYVRLTAADAVNTYSGNVSLSSSGATTQNVAIPSSSVVAVNAFTPGNLVIEQADVSTTQNTTATMVEVNAAATTTQSSPVQSIPLPGLNINSDPTIAQALRINGSGGTTGYLATTNDGTELSVVDPNALSNSDLTQTTAASILNRTVVTFGSAGNLVFQAHYTGSSGNQARGATSLDDVNWIVADKGGIYVTSAASPATTTSTTTTNMLATKSFGGQVYGFSGTAPGVTSVTTSGTTPPIGTLNTLTGLSIASGTDFYLISSGVNGAAFDVCYVCTETSATAGTIYKYSLVSGTWTANGSYTTNFGGRSMVAEGSGSGAVLYLTGGDGGTADTSVVKVTDTAGWNQTINVTTANNLNLYTFTGTAVPKGIAFAPLAASLPDLTIAASAPSSSTSTSFSYTLTLANSGAANASGVAASFTLPSGLTYVSAADNGSNGFTPSYSAGVVSFSGGTLNANSSDTITVNVTGTAGSSYVVDAGTSPASGHGSTVINPGATIAESNSSNNGSNVSVSTGLFPPSINVTGTPLSALSTSFGIASTPATFSVSGSYLTSNITVTAPTGFELSTASGSGYGSSVTLTESGGTVSTTPLYVRLAATTTSGSYSGNVSLTSSGATTVNVAIPSSTVSPSANLSSLATSTGSFTQAFAAATTSYTEYVASSVTSLTLTPAADTGATVTVNGVSSSTPISLNTGSNTITVSVTASTGGAPQAYTINVIRAGPFTPGDLVVTTYGNIAVAPVHADNQTTLITLAEFSPTIATNSTPLMTVVLPSAVAGNNVGIAGEYGSSSEGTPQLTADGLYLTLGGYSAVPALAYNNYNTAGSLATAQSPCTTVPRVFALIDVNSNCDTTSVFNDIYNTNNPRAVYSADDVNLYVSGQATGTTNDEGGVYYTQVGTNTTMGGSAPTGVFNGESTRDVQVYGGNLYYSADQNNSHGVLTGLFEYTGTPTTSQSGPGTVIVPANNGSGINYSPEDFFFANATTLYVADTGDPKAGGTSDGGIQKWVYNGSAWVLAYTLTPPSNFVPASQTATATSGETGFESITGKVVSGVAYLYAVSYTAGDANPNGLYGITDTVSATSSAGQTFTEIAASPGIQASGTNPDYVFKGVSFAPTGSPVNTAAASGVTNTGATLNGTINPNGTDTVVYFQYGTTTSYGSTTTTEDLGSGTLPVPFSIPIPSGLLPGTTYNYRLVTVANGLTSTYANQTFTTSNSSSPVVQPTDTPTMPAWALVALALALMGVSAKLLNRKNDVS